MRLIAWQLVARCLWCVVATVGRAYSFAWARYTAELRRLTYDGGRHG